MRWIAALALVMLATQSTAASGRITGVVTDGGGGRIPGSTITLRWADGERTTVTNSEGEFSFDDVRPGRYAVLATLHGFYGHPQTGVAVFPRATAAVKLTLETDCMEGVSYPEIAVARAVRDADAIAHIRISAPNPPLACGLADLCSCALHEATVLRALKGRPPAQLRLLQEDAGYGQREKPYAAADEFIALLNRDLTNHAFRRLAGPTLIWRVRHGRVEFKRTDVPGLRDGITVEEFLKALRAIGR